MLSCNCKWGILVADLLARYPVAAKAIPGALAEQIGPRASLIRARNGQTVTALGAASNSVYILLEGRVQVTIFSLGGREVVLRNLKAGTLFGDLSALDERPRSATIVAIGDTLLASIPGEVFRDAVCQTPEAALWMVRRLATQARDLTDKVFELTVLRVAGRLHCELLRLCDSPSGEGRTAVIDPFPTHAELASRIGSHREAVTREMRFLADQGILVQDGRRTTITDLPALQTLIRDAVGELAEAEWLGSSGG